MVFTVRIAISALAFLLTISEAWTRPSSGPSNLEGMVFVLPDDNTPMVLADPSNLALSEDYDANQDRNNLGDSLTLPERPSLLNLESRYFPRPALSRRLRSLRTSSSSSAKELQRGNSQKRALSIFMALPNPSGGMFSSGGQETERNLDRAGKPIRPYGMPLRWG